MLLSASAEKDQGVAELSCFPFTALFPPSSPYIPLTLSFVPKSYHLILFCVFLSFHPSFLYSLEVVSLTFPAPLLSTQSSSCSFSPPQTSVCDRWENSDIPSVLHPSPFSLCSLHLFSLVLLFAELPHSHLPSPPSSASSLHLQLILSASPHLSPFSLRLTPFGSSPVLYIYKSFLTPFLTSVKLPLLPFHLSSVLFPALSLPLQSMTAVSHLTSLLPFIYLFNFFAPFLHLCPLFLLSPLTSSS